VLRVFVCAAPVDGEANKSVIALVARVLGIPKSSIAIKRGEASRDKVLALASLDAAELAKRLSNI
jgi:uncharacterized protein YggU (UPF0235/DUF167 family)